MSGFETSDARLLNDSFPRASRYNPDWVIRNGMGSNPLWLVEWLTSAMELQPGMRVLDLGCGRATSSVFLAREFNIQVWSTDLWISASENIRRIRDANLDDRVFPIHADAHALPFAAGFFDAIISVDSFSYYGTDDLYLNYLANFVRAGGQIGIAGAGLVDEFDEVPESLRPMWTEDFWCLHSAQWWQRHWGRTGIVDVETADRMEDGWKLWLLWHETAHPDNTSEIDMVRTDAGENLTYIRAVARRRDTAELVDYCWPDTLRSMPEHYESLPILRESR